MAMMRLSITVQIIQLLSFNPEMCGWGASLAHMYFRKADIINRGGEIPRPKLT